MVFKRLTDYEEIDLVEYLKSYTEQVGKEKLYLNFRLLEVLKG